jgi:flagellar L-ring protein precursor FlgH
MNTITLSLKRIQFMAAVILSLLLPPSAFSQSLWHNDSSRSMFADKRAMAVGDIITVVVSESSTESKNNSTVTEKKSSLSAQITSFLFPGFLAHKAALPAMNYSSDLAHNGSGTISDSETVVAQIAVRVIDVLPNGDFVIEGKRQTSFSEEQQTIVLHGVVRSEDVSSTDTVQSYNVADATIQIIGKGTVSDSQNKGWFTRVWDKINPF